MGQNLALNLSHNKVKVIAFDKNPSNKNSGEFECVGSHFELVDKLKSPRVILLLVPAGNPVDEVIDSLSRIVDKGDVIVDLGNSSHLDTIRRTHSLQSKGIEYLGCGISGGSRGALNGASLMPSGSHEAYDKAKPVLDIIAARTDTGYVCSQRLGNAGAGHFVKMVHNGIEYVEMQLIAEIYEVMKRIYGLTTSQIADQFELLNSGLTKSFLMGITTEILRKKDEENNSVNLIDLIKDVARQKGTGSMVVQEGLEMNTVMSLIYTALNARYVSSNLTARSTLGNEEQKFSFKEYTSETLDKIKEIILLVRILTFDQGINLLEDSNNKFKWDIDIVKCFSVWRSGSILESALVDKLSEELKTDDFYILDAYKDQLNQSLASLKEININVLEMSLFAPIINESFQLMMGYTNKCLPLNLVQGMRDYFGGHGYERRDKEGSFYTEW